MAKRCVWCRQPGASDEHGIPQWVSRAIGGGGTFTVTDHVRVKERRNLRVINLITRDACGPCNDGWMSDLEEMAKPILLPMFQGVETELTPARQRVVALWTVKTVLMMDRIKPGARSFSAADYHWVYDHREPPPSTFVWLAAFGGDLTARYYSNWSPAEPPPEPIERGLKSMRRAISAGRRPAVHCATFSIQHAVFQLLNHIPRSERTVETDAERSGVALRVWPPRLDSFVWPPMYVFDIASLDRFSRPNFRLE